MVLRTAGIRDLRCPGRARRAWYLSSGREQLERRALHPIRLISTKLDQFFAGAVPALFFDKFATPFPYCAFGVTFR
jgi:hypothetical protein